MITATYTQGNGYVSLCLNYPKGAKIINVRGTVADAWRLVYYHNRKYIIEKLTSWLSQRKVAIKMSSDRRRVLDVAQLQVLVSYHHGRSLYRICSEVKVHRSMFEKVAIGKDATTSAYFNNTIKPILDYCDQAD